jgi:SnoaL-like domain
MDLPAPIADFFRMKNEHDDSELPSLFSDDATVVDGGEGKTMHGKDEIQAWVTKSIAGINLHTEIESYAEQDGQWVVDTVMRGDFKASPARFLYTIGLRGNKISALRVEFRGSRKEDS